MSDLFDSPGDPLAPFTSGQKEPKIQPVKQPAGSALADPFASVKALSAQTQEAAQEGRLRDPFAEVKELSAQTNEAVEGLRSSLPWAGTLTPAQVISVNRKIADSPDPIDQAYRLGTAYQFARIAGISPDEAYNNLDALAMAYTSKPYEPKTTMRILGDAWNSAWLAYDMGNKAFQWSLGGGTDTALEKELDAMQAKINELDEDRVLRPWYIDSLRSCAGSLPQMITGGIKGAGVAAGAGLLAAAAGVEVGTGGLGTPVAVGAAMGGMAMVGSAMDMYQWTQGLAYHAMRKQGHSHDVAQAMSTVSAFAQAATEGLVESIPGLGLLTGTGVDDLLTKIVAKRTAQSGLLNVAAIGLTRYGTRMAGEGAEEFWQYLEDMGAQVVAQSIEDVGFKGPTAKEAIKQAGRQFVGGALAAGLLGFGDGAKAFKNDARQAAYIKAKAQSAMREGFDFRQFKAHMEAEYRLAEEQGFAPVLSQWDDETREKMTKALWDAGKKEAEAAKAREEKAGLTLPDVDSTGEEAEGEVKRIDDRLYTQNRTVVDVEGDGTVHAIFKLGDPTAKGKSKRLATIDYEVDGDTLTIRTVSGKISQDVKQEFILDLLEQHPGKEVLWKPKSEEDQALYDKMVSENPRGPEAGINWYSEGGTIDTVRNRLQLTRKLQAEAPKMGLTKEQIPAAVDFIDRSAAFFGLSTDDYLARAFTAENFVTGKAPAGALNQAFRGATEFKPAGDVTKALIYYAENADFSTYIHENTHALINFGIRNRSASEKVSARMAEIEQAFGVKGGNWNEEAADDWQQKYYQAAKTAGHNLTKLEAVAYAMEDYLREGKAPKAELEPVFKRIAQWLYDVYQNLAARVNINPDIRRVFDELFDGEGPLGTRAREEAALQEKPKDSAPKAREAFDKNTRPDQKPKQPANTLDEIYGLVEESREFFTKWTDELAEKHGVEIHARKSLKAKDRAARKITAEEGPETILDIDGKTLIAPDLATIDRIMRDIQGRDEIVRIKDRFAKPAPGDYRDMLLNVKMPNGAIVELQITSAQLLEAKETGHLLYEVSDQVAAGVKDGRLDEGIGQKISDAAMDGMRALYGPAYEATLSGAIFKASPADISEQLGRISEGFQESGTGSSVLSEKTRNKLDALMASGLSSQSTKTSPGSVKAGVSITTSSSTIGQTAKENKPEGMPLFQATVEEIRDDKGRLLAPNGKPSALNENQWKQVRTDAFKAWFGDWQNDPANASKVVDENGEPQVVYHGTTASTEYEEFHNDRATMFTPHHLIANIFAGGEQIPGRVYPVFLSIKKPYYGSYTDAEGIAYQQSEMAKDKAKGYDGLIYKGDPAYANMAGEGRKYTQIAVYSNTQIKSATGNVGTFDEKNPSILYQSGREIDRVVYTFPAELKGYSDIHSQSQISGVLNAFGRGVLGNDGTVRIGDVGTSHAGLARGLSDAKRFYFGYSRDKRAVYVVAKNGMDADAFKKPAVLQNILSQVFDKYKLNVTPGKRLAFQEKEDPRVLFQDAAEEIESKPSMLAIHNIDSEHIASMEEFGGMPSPSIAYTKPNIPFEDYGDVSLILKKDKAIEIIENRQVYDRDIYSPTIPAPEYKIDKKKEYAFEREMHGLLTYEERRGMRSAGLPTMENMSEGEKLRGADSTVKWLDKSYAVRIAYLREQKDGYKIPQTTKKPEIGINESAEFRDWLVNAMDEYNQKGYEDGEKDLEIISKRIYKESKERPVYFFGVHSDNWKSYEDVPFHTIQEIYSDASGAGKKIVNEDRMRREVDKRIKENHEEYIKWLTAKIEPMYSAPRLKVRGRYEPFNAASVQAWMETQNTKAAQKTMTFGPGKAQAMAAIAYWNRENMKDDEGNLVSQEEEKTFRKEKIEPLDAEIRDKLPKYSKTDGWDTMDNIYKAIAEYYKVGRTTPKPERMKRALSSNGFTNVPEYLVEKVTDLAHLMQSAPVQYFEGKPNEILTFKDFAAAIVPKTLKSEGRETLERAGVAIYEYGDKKDRAALVKEITENEASAGSILFQEAPPTDSKEFKAWFGDSKVVDAAGKPLVVYHGTASAGFDAFRPGLTYFSTDPIVADAYTTKSNSAIAKPASYYKETLSPGIYQAYLSIKKPFDTRDTETRKVFDEQFNGKSGENWTSNGTPIDPDRGLPDWTDAEDLAAFIEEEGLDYDGLILAEAHGSITYAPMRPEQIKSVNNRGTWDVNDPRILYQPAYHGSPYRFDKFTTEKMGSGEGNQAYGWGLYFSGEKKVAEFYRKTLAKTDSPQTFYAGGKRLEENTPERHAASLLYFNDTKEIRTWAKNALKEAQAGDIGMDDTAKKAGLTSEEYWRRVNKFVQDHTKRDVKAEAGQLYRVEIPAEDEYLDWEKPYREQSQNVKDALGRIFDRTPVEDRALDDFDVKNKNGLLKLIKEAVDGQEIYGTLTDIYRTDKDASDALRAAGVPGITYLDADSRAKGKGTHNYVIFSGEDVEITETLYQHSIDDLKKSAKGYDSWEAFRDFWESGFVKDDDDTQTEGMAPEEVDEFYRTIYGIAKEEPEPEKPITAEEVNDEDAEAEFVADIKTDAGLRAYLMDLYGASFDKAFYRDMEAAGPSDEEEARRYDAMRSAERIVEKTAAPTVYLGAKAVNNGTATKKILASARGAILNNPTEYRRLVATVQGDTETASRLKAKLDKPYILDPRWVATAEVLSIEKRKQLARTIRNEKIARKIVRGDIAVEDPEIEEHLKYLSEEAKKARKTIAETEAKALDLEDRLGTTQRAALKQSRELSEYRDRLKIVERRAAAYLERQAAVPAKTAKEADFLRKQIATTQAALEKAKAGAKTDAAELDALSSALAARKERNRLQRLEAERRAVKAVRDEMKRLAAAATKPLGKKPGMPVEYQKKIKELQAGLDPQFRTKSTLAKLDHWRDWIARDPGAAEIMPDDLVKKVQAKQLNDWTLDELRQFKDRIDELKNAGHTIWKIRHNREAQERNHMADDFREAALAGEEFRPAVGAPKPSTTWTKIKLATLRPLAVFLELDGGKRGPFTKWLWDAVNEAEAEANLHKDRRKAAAEAKLKELGFTTDILDDKYVYIGKEMDIDGFVKDDGRKPTLQDVLYWQIGRQNEETYRALLAGSRYPEAVIDKGISMLSKEALALAEYIGQDFDENFPRLKEAFEYQYNMPLNAVDHYVPMRRLEATFDTRGEEVAVGLVSGTGQTKTFLNKGFTKSRIQEIQDDFQRPIRTDLVSIWMESIDKEEDFIAKDWLVKRLQDTLNRLPVQRAIQQRLGPEGVKWMKKYVNDIAQGNANQAITGSQKFMQQLRGRMAVSYLSFNVLSNLKQLVSPLPYLADAGGNPITGGARLLSAASQYLKGIRRPGQQNALVKFVEDHSDLIKHRSISRDIEDFKRIEASHNASENVRKAIALEKKIGAVGMASLEVIDHVSVCIGWKAVYDYNISQRKGELEAIQAADDATVLTQPSGRVQDLAEIYRSGETMKFFTMFTNALNAQWQMIAFRIPRAFRQKQYLHALGDAIALALCGLGIALVSGAAYGDDDEEKRKRLVLGLFSQYTDSIPLVGSIATAAISKAAGVQTYTSEGVNPFPWGPKALSAVSAIQDRDIAKALAYAAEGAALGLGLPTTGPKRAIDALIDKDPALLIGWKKESDK